MLFKTKKVKHVYSFLVATKELVPGMAEQIFPYAWNQLRESKSAFKKLYDQVEKEDSPHTQGNGLAASSTHFADAFTQWMRSQDVSLGEFKSLVNKQLFVFSGDAKNPQDGSSFAWSVCIYFEFE